MADWEAFEKHVITKFKEHIEFLDIFPKNHYKQ